jgi:hypothetical protein
VSLRVVEMVETKVALKGDSMAVMMDAKLADGMAYMTVDKMVELRV